MLTKSKKKHLSRSL